MIIVFLKHLIDINRKYVVYCSITLFMFLLWGIAAAVISFDTNIPPGARLIKMMLCWWTY